MPRRIVSLVPSLTELLADWGLVPKLAARTRYCEEPRELLASVETVGGTKNPDVWRIVELRPDLVVVNAEENRREDYEALVAAGLRVHVTHPRTLVEAVEMFLALGEAVGERPKAEKLAHSTREALASASARSSGRRLHVFCPIWRNPWMTFHEHTYVGDMLRVAGLANVFGEEGDRDFFEVEIEDARRRGPELVLLPDEPYVFGSKHADELRELGFDARIELFSGKDLSWYGPRTPGAIARLGQIAARVV